EDAPFFHGDRVVTVLFVPVSEEGSIFGLCILRDISRQYFAEKHNRELDDALKLIKKMEAMSCMAGGVAHDFNNLLTVICGNLDIVSLGSKDNNNIKEDQWLLLEEAKKAALAAVDLTHQISGFSNFGIISREHVKLNQLVANALEDFFGPNSNLYAAEYCPEDCTVSIDPEELVRALDNILQNAQEASFRKLIDIRVSCCEFTSPCLMSGQYVPGGQYARIDVRDYGPGIEPDKLFKIFDPYYSTKQRGSMKGMGLGLTVVYATLRNHGGYVVVSSTPGKETTVSLFLPIVQGVKRNKSSEDHRNIERANGKGNVLLIEPQQQMSEIGQIMLSHLGFSVTAVSGRNDALRELKRMKGKPMLANPLVIMDINGSEDGEAVETCRLLHELDPELQIIGATGAMGEYIIANCRQYGFVNILPKPYSIDGLNHVTSTVLYS
ncbi:MAG: ATP-binding protein, partial [Desulforhopalus sp.]